MATRPGLVHFEDLANRYDWRARAIEPIVAAAGLEVAEWPPAHRGFAPPRVLVAVVDFERTFLVRRALPWLVECAHVVLVRTRASDLEDELAELLAEPWQEVLAALPQIEVVDWRDANDPGLLRAALARAIELARTVDELPPVAIERHDLELPMSPWITWGKEMYRNHQREIASMLAMRDGRPVLVDARGVAHDLAAPPAQLALDYDYELTRGRPPGMSVEAARNELPGFFIAGSDPHYPITWRGVRMGVYWMYRGGFLSATDHDFPTGPGKKLWGYEDNEPVATALAPAGDICAQTFDHDVLITSAIPVGWYRAGPVDVAAFRRDPQRVAYYAYTGEFVERLTTDMTDEDNRELAPVVVLGPDAKARYALDLRHHVVRITGPNAASVAEAVGGPDAGYIVCDAGHAVVRRGTGQLLGGWFRYATIEDDGWIWREDLATGERTVVCSASRVACVDPEAEMVVHDAIREGRHADAAKLRATHATSPIDGERSVLAIPGTRNVLELVGEHLRVL